MTARYICIVCPNSCRLTVEEDGGEIAVSGHECERGLRHGVSEYTAPTRMLTTTVAVAGGALPRLPVISSGELPKSKLWDCLDALYRMELTAPVRCGQVVVQNICGAGVDVVASRTLEARAPQGCAPS